MANTAGTEKYNKGKKAMWQEEHFGIENLPVGGMSTFSGVMRTCIWGNFDEM